MSLNSVNFFKNRTSTMNDIDFIKIVYIASRSLNNIGGIENYMKNLCPRMVKNNYKVVLYVQGDKYSKSNYYGVTVISMPSVKNKFFNKIFIAAQGTFHSLITNRNVDIYHYNAIPSAAFSFLPILLGKNVVYQGHGFEWQRGKWSSKMKKLISVLERFVIAINKNFTMVSDDQSEYIKKFGKNSVTITPGVDVIDKEYDTQYVHKYELMKKNYVFFLGRLVPEKSPDVLIKAFNKLEKADLKLVISGDDPNEKEYIKYLKRLARNNTDIVFTGAVYGDEKKALMQHCKLFCIPSELEGLPITLLEAMSQKKICLASDIPANKEALNDTGVFFGLNNVDDLSRKILDIVDYPEKYERLGGLAKVRIEQKFTWDRIADQFDDYYHTILNNA